jgi:hypothetical protein
VSWPRSSTPRQRRQRPSSPMGQIKGGLLSVRSGFCSSPKLETDPSSVPTQSPYSARRRPSPAIRDAWAGERDNVDAASRRDEVRALRGAPAWPSGAGRGDRSGSKRPEGGGRTRSSRRRSSLRGRGCRKSSLFWALDYGAVRRPTVAGITGGRGRAEWPAVRASGVRSVLTTSLVRLRTRRR